MKLKRESLEIIFWRLLYFLSIIAIAILNIFMVVWAYIHTSNLIFKVIFIIFFIFIGIWSIIIIRY